MIYQPHRFSRTKDCWNDYKSCFQNLDQLYLLDIYPAGESPIEGIDSKNLGQFIEAPVRYCQSFDEAIQQVVSNVKNSDIVLTMGAGHVWQCASQLLEKINAR